MFPRPTTTVKALKPATVRSIAEMFDQFEPRGDRRELRQELERLVRRGSQSVRVLAQNDSDHFIDAGEVLGIDRLLIERHENAAEWSRDVDVIASLPRRYHDGYVIVDEPIRPGGTGEAVLTGVVNVRVQRRNPAHGYAQPMPGRHQNLVSCYDGPVRILSWDADSNRLNDPTDGSFLTTPREFTPYAGDAADEHLPIVWAKGVLDPQYSLGRRSGERRLAYVAQSVTAAVVVDRDLDDDDGTDDVEDPDTVVDDDLEPGRGSVTFHEFRPSRYGPRIFPIAGFVQADGVDVPHQIILDTSASPFSAAKLARLLDAAALPTDSRVFVQGSSTLDAAGRRVTANDGVYYLTADASFDAGANTVTLTLDRDLLPLPDTLDGGDPETLGSVSLERWAPTEKYTDAADNLASETEPVWNWWEDESFTTGTPVVIEWQQNRWIIVPAACEVSGLDLTPDVEI